MKIAAAVFAVALAGCSGPNAEPAPAPASPTPQVITAEPVGPVVYSEDGACWTQELAGGLTRRGCR